MEPAERSDSSRLTFEEPTTLVPLAVAVGVVSSTTDPRPWAKARLRWRVSTPAPLVATTMRDSLLLLEDGSKVIIEPAATLVEVVTAKSPSTPATPSLVPTNTVVPLPWAFSRAATVIVVVPPPERTVRYSAREPAGVPPLGSMTMGEPSGGPADARLKVVAAAAAAALV